jgi:hypothetical protein
MKPTFLALTVAFITAAFVSTTALAQAPAGSTGECKDGTYSSAEKKKGACKGHGGVKEWYAETKAGTTTESKAAAPATTPTKPATTSDATAKSTKKTNEPAKEAAAGGGPGKVWVNTSSNVYHCSGDKWYGKTKQGEYMSEADAKAKGAHADHGKACS